MGANLTGPIAPIAFEFATVARGREILTTRDEFTKNLSSHEYYLKMGVDRPGRGSINEPRAGDRLNARKAGEEGTGVDRTAAERTGADRTIAGGTEAGRTAADQISESDFFRFLESCVLPWGEEVSQLERALGKVKEKLAGLKVALKAPVMLIKTDGREEWNSAYTRSGAVILPRKKIENYSGGRLEDLLIHEIFHVISKSYPGLRNILYGLAGFAKINDIALPPELKAIVLTNPDAPYLNYYTAVTYREKKLAVMPVTLLKKERKNIDSSRDILKSITAKLLVLQRRGEEFRAAGEDGRPILLDFRDIQGFKAKTGFDKEGFFSPEEAIAGVFTKMVNGSEVPHKRLSKGINKVLFQVVNGR